MELITIGNLRKHYISSSKYVRKHYVLAKIKELASYLLFRRQDPNNPKEIIISCADAVTEHLNIFYNRLSERYILPGVPIQGKMVELMDKTTMISMIVKRGITSPEIWNLPDERVKVTFPCITKAYISSHGSKSDVVVCRSQEQLDGIMTNCNDEVFAQAYIDKLEEVQLIGCSLNGGQEVIIPGMSKILRSQPNTNTGFLEYGPIDPFYNDVVAKAKLYIQDCEYSGLFSFEVMRDKRDKIWFLETNFRNDGNAWCVTRSGINLPVIWVKACLGEDYSSEIKTPKKIVMMPEFQDIKLVLQRSISISQWIKDWRRTDFFMEYDKKDPKPFWQYIINKLI